MDVDSYIDSIARALAQRGGGGGGRATAMIGAGFSRNAEKRTESARSFPLWRDIVRPLIDELLPPCSECMGSDNCGGDGIAGGREVCKRRASLLADAAGASGMMALGDKFEAKKGSARLRAALESAVPDRDYGPGRAHQLLVRLPWADILTTNWDTLLEQAVDAYDRSYDKVITVKQIASATAPRIVKLHGCARSGTDLIFTEESFRTYPKKYAPFVSLVQQSLMENIIVLFGFSGADPNFRAWHGWVRDHLGNNLQPIYMVSLRPTEPIDINLMAGRLITHINLSEKWPHLEDGMKIEAFLDEIQKRLRGLKVNLDWPSNHHVPTGDASPNNLAANVHAWKQRQNSYPGWLVAPARNRADLVSHLDEALNVAFERSYTERNRGLAALVEPNTHRPGAGNASEFLTDREQTALIVVDALRIAMARPGKRLWEILQDILAGALVDLFGIDCDDPTACSTDGRPESSRLFDLLDQKILAPLPAGVQQQNEAARAKGIIEALPAEHLKGEQRALIRDVVFRLLPLVELIEREARLRSDHQGAKRLRDILWLAGGNNAVREIAARGALVAALERFDLHEIQSLLLLWPGQQHDASSNLRHAAVQREIGKIRDAYTEILAIVTRLRSLGNERRRGVAESSREAWAFYLYADLLERNMPDIEAILAPQSEKLMASDVYEELLERLDELDVNRCDPRREMDRIARDIEAATERTRLERMLAKARRGPIQADVPAGETVRTEGADERQHVLDDPANTFVIMSETIGVAIHHVSRGYPLALIASRLLAATNRQLAINLLLRAGTPEDLPFAHTIRPDEKYRTDQDDWLVAEVVFDREHSREDFNMLSGLLERLAAPSPGLSSDFMESSYLDKKFRLLQHLIAGLIEREKGPLANDLAEAGFAVACKIAYSPVVAATHAGWSNCLSLFEAAFARFPFRKRKAYEILTKLLDLPIPTESNDSSAASWPDPIQMLVEAWYPRAVSTTEATLPTTELSKLGTAITDSVTLELKHNDPLRSVLHDHERRWEAMMELSGRMRRKIIARRIALIRSVIRTKMEETPATQRPIGRKPKRAKKDA